jgi:DNA-binding transcriptional LysR family regulator
MSATTTPDLNQVSAFVRVMESGSFTAAARTLGLPTSSVSRRVSALETALRVRLLQRSSRKLAPTEAGRLYFERARAALGGLADANAAVTDLSQEIAGTIRFTAGGDNTGLLASLLSEFLARHPKIQIDVVLTPRRVDLVGEGFDLALRAGPLVDSSLVARRLGRTELGLFASRSYLRKAGRPKSVAELAGHRFVLFGQPHEREHLRLTGPDGEQDVAIQGPLVVHDMSFAADAIATGIGIGLVPDMYFGWMIKGGLRRAGRDLVRLLPDHGVVGAELSLVSPPKAYEPARVALLRDFLAERLRPLVQDCALAVEAERTTRHAAKERARKQRDRRAARAAS